MNSGFQVRRNTVRTAFYLGCFWLTIALVPGRASASVREETGYVTITEENDSLGNPFSDKHQDRHYTQGLKIVLFGGDDFFPKLTNTLNQCLPAVGIQPAASHLGWIILGQNIYTPSNILASTRIKNDRPYAGWLYTGFIFQRRGEITPNLAVMENFEINLGVVGPNSLADESQEAVHRWWFADDVPQGWDHQIHNEPGLELKYLRSWRYSPTPTLSRFMDVLGRVGGEVGNVADVFTAGGTFRIGYNLPQDFGAALIDSPGSASGGCQRDTPWFRVYGFASIDGRIVGHDISLDGNSFSGGPSISKNVFVADFSWGFGFQLFRHLECTYTRTIRTEQFRGQDGNDVFGSVTLKGTYGF